MVVCGDFSGKKENASNSGPREDGVSGRDWGAARMRRKFQNAATTSLTGSRAGIAL
jgi:hypothetical protein